MLGTLKISILILALTKRPKVIRKRPVNLPIRNFAIAEPNNPS